MNKKSKTILIILSLIFLLLVSCGIPNYFGNVGKYVEFSSTRLSISSKELSDGFKPEDVEPKLMFLYTIYSYDSVKDISLNTVESKLKSKFIDDYKLAEYDYRGCTNAENSPVVEVVIKDNNEKEHTFGLYQFKTTEVLKNPASYTGTPTNYSSDYLFNKANMEFLYDHDYTFTYDLERVGTSDTGRLVISCKNEDGDVVSSYAMGNYTNDNFNTKYDSNATDDYLYFGNKSNLYILPVLYLESSVYSNRQMKVGEWKEIPLTLPELPEAEKEEGTTEI